MHEEEKLLKKLLKKNQNETKLLTGKKLILKIEKMLFEISTCNYKVVRNIMGHRVLFNNKKHAQMSSTISYYLLTSKNVKYLCT